jgi:signal transduction histidine kinase
MQTIALESEAGDESEIFLDADVNNHLVFLMVKDTGIGIPEEDQKHMFQKFFRVNNAANIQGPGLGLNIVKRYVELLDGNINFQNKVNEGTTFTVEFPKTKTK